MYICVLYLRTCRMQLLDTSSRAQTSFRGILRYKYISICIYLYTYRCIYVYMCSKYAHLLYAVVSHFDQRAGVARVNSHIYICAYVYICMPIYVYIYIFVLYIGLTRGNVHICSHYIYESIQSNMYIYI